MQKVGMMGGGGHGDGMGIRTKFDNGVRTFKLMIMFFSFKGGHGGGLWGAYEHGMSRHANGMYSLRVV